MVSQLLSPVVGKGCLSVLQSFIVGIGVIQSVELSGGAREDEFGEAIFRCELRSQMTISIPGRCLSSGFLYQSPFLWLKGIFWLLLSFLICPSSLAQTLRGHGDSESSELSETEL